MTASRITSNFRVTLDRHDPESWTGLNRNGGPTSPEYATFTYNLRFLGQYYDDETELHYNYYRTYDPSTGRYFESDPIGLVGGANTYGYVSGNPLSYFDRYGLLMEDYAAAEAILRDYAARNGQKVPARIGIGLSPISEAIGAFGETLPSWRRGKGDPGFRVTDRYYERCINDDEARRLLTTYIHENIHYNHSLWEEFLLSQFQDDQFQGSGDGAGDRIHDEVYREARSVADELFPKLNELRRQKIAYFLDSADEEWIPKGCECYDYYHQ